MAVETIEAQDGKEEEKKAAGTESTEETVTLTKSDLEALIDSKIKNATTEGSSSELLKELVAQLSANKADPYKKFDELEYMSPMDIDVEDRLEDPVVFWAAGSAIIIGDDKKNKQAIPAPYGVIVFKFEGSKQGYRGRDIHIQMWCKYESWSKKEVEFLKNHRLFGARFFLKSSTAMTIDVRYAQQLANFAQALRSQPMNQVIDQARSLDLVITDDPDSLRLAVAQHKAKEYMEQFAESEKVRLKENSKEALVNN